MPAFINNIIEFIGSSSFNTVQIAVLGYFGLLWLAIIIWVTRDSLHRSNSLIFQTLAILINIAIPILGVILYIIIRPGQTNAERYYEDLEHKMLSGEDSGHQATCEKCLTIVDKDYVFCPNCTEKLKNSCSKCRKKFPAIWGICPYCGSKYTEKEKTVKKGK